GYYPAAPQGSGRSVPAEVRNQNRLFSYTCALSVRRVSSSASCQKVSIKTRFPLALLFDILQRSPFSPAKGLLKHAYSYSSSDICSSPLGGTARSCGMGIFMWS